MMMINDLNRGGVIPASKRHLLIRIPCGTLVTPSFRQAAFHTHPSPLLPSDIMGLAGVLSVFVVKRHEKPWEVVDNKTVEPVPLFDEDDGAFPILPGRDETASYFCFADIDIIYVHKTRVVRTFVFDVRRDQDLENSLLFAQQQFFEEVQRKGYNALWSEGCVQRVLLPRLDRLLISDYYRWQLTLLRKAKRHRVEVKYTGQPACLTGKAVQHHPPPFLAVLAELRSACVL
jgi:hypothetical protein